MHTRSKRPLVVSGAAMLGAIALTLGGAVAAQAHVGLGGTSDEAGSSTLLTFSFSHGCDGSPTNGIAIQIPEGINAVTPTVNPGWTVEKVTEGLETPIQDSHGNDVTERVSQIVYTAKDAIEDGLRETFALSLTFPEDAAGSTLAFPTVQSCVDGENAWVQVAAEGQDPHDLAFPAPTIGVVAASNESGDQAHGDESAAGDTDATADAPAETGQTPLIVTSLVVGGLGLVVALIALVSRGRKKA